MRILYISVELPYPLNSGGSVAVFNRIKELSRRGHEIYLFCPATSGIDQNAVQILNQFCTVVKVYPMSKVRILMNLLMYPLMPFRTARRLNNLMQNEIAEFLRSTPVDLFIVEHSNMAGYFMLDYMYAVRSIIVFQALVHKSFRRIAEHLKWWNFMRLVYLLESYKTRLTEERILISQYFDEYWFYSNDDMCEVIERFPTIKDKARLILLGVELKSPGQEDPGLIPGIQASDKIILLVGSMDNPSNEDAVRWFVRDIFPAVRREVSEARLLVIGKNSKYKLRDIASEWVTVLGEVVDLRPYFHRCQVYVVPQRGGAGVRVKLLDGLASKSVVISTPIGTEALKDLQVDRHYLLATGEDEFARKVVSVLRDPSRYYQMAENGFNFAKANFSVQAVGDVVENYILMLCKKNAT